MVLNRFAGLGDEMGLIIKKLKENMAKNENEINKLRKNILEIDYKKDEIIKELVEKLTVSDEEKSNYRQKLSDMEKTLKAEQEKIDKIKDKLVRNYYPAKNIITELERRNFKIEPKNWYNPMSQTSFRIMYKNITIFIENTRIVILQLDYINGEYYIAADSLTLGLLISRGYLNPKALEVVKL